MASPGGALIGWGAVVITQRTSGIYAVIFATIGAAIMGAIISGLNYKRFIQPMQKIIATINDMASGNLAKSVNEDSVGELKPIAIAINSMGSTWSTILEKVNDTTNEVSMQTSALTSVADESSTVFEQITNKMESVAQSVTSQSKGAEESVMAMEEIATSIQRIAENARVISDQSKNSFSQAEIVKSGSNDIITHMKTIEKSVKQTANYVQQLGMRSDKIVEIIRVISGISEQTSLLALNASIEAARAGEHGQGFSVVASEVRELAEQSEQSAAEITHLVQDVNENIASSIETMRNLEQIVVEGINVVEINDGAIDVIVEATNYVNEEIQETTISTDELSASSEQVVAILEQMKGTSQTASEHSLEIVETINKQTSSIENIFNSVEALNLHASQLQNILQNFTNSEQ